MVYEYVFTKTRRKHGNATWFTSLWAFTYTILNRKENLRFGKITKGTTFPCFTYGFFYKKNRKHFFFHVSAAIKKHLWKFRKTRNFSKISPFGLVFPLEFLVLQNFHSCFYNCMKTQEMFSISRVQFWQFTSSIKLLILDYMSRLCFNALWIRKFGNFYHLKWILERVEYFQWSVNTYRYLCLDSYSKKIGKYTTKQTKIKR